MELHEALKQVAEIRQRMAESEIFRGYRSLPIAASGLLALAAGWLQPFLVPAPAAEPRDYVLLWSAVALLSMGAAALTIGLRDCLLGPSHTRTLTWIAVRQLVPCLVSGVAVTMAIVRFAPQAAWLLPGLWQLFFAQGIFASCRVLPRPVYLVVLFFLATGSMHFFIFRDGSALSPLAMALPFGAGQFLAASILYWALERSDAVETET